MTMKYYLTLALAALALTVACQKENTPTQNLGKIQVEPIITKATEVNFEEGDRVGLTVKVEGAAEDYASNACFTYAGDLFSGSLEWYADIYTPADFYAYYPYNESGAPTSYFQHEDQSAGIGAADFMMASKKGVRPSMNAVAMVFKHMMTKLVINIDNESGAGVDKVEVLSGTLGVDLDYENMALLPCSGALPAVCPQTVTYEAVAGKTWQMILIPQTAPLELIVTLSNRTVIRQNLVSTTYKSGGQYTINARILPDNMIVSASGEIENWTDEGEVDFEGGSSSEQLPVEFVEHDGYFVYDGVEYKTVQLADGNTWMAENLRFVPRGRTVSSDPAEDAGIWYPAANAEKVADPTLVESLGLLYDAATAFGVEAVTLDNAATFEGAQGICPRGWHIPTLTEMTGLVGHCSNSAVINTDGAYYDSTVKGASLAALEADGWAWQFASMRNKANLAGTGSYTVTNYNGTYGIMSYLIGSSLYQITTNTDGSLKNVQYYYFMPTYNATNEKVTVAYGNFLAGASLRCVKDK